MASAASAASAASGEKTVKKINRKPQPTITPFDFEDALESKLLESELARHDMEIAHMIANMTPQARAEYDKEQAELARVQAESDKDEEETARILAKFIASPNLDSDSDSDSDSHSRLSSSSSTATATATDDDAPPDSDSTPPLTDEDAANAAIEDAMEAAILEVGNAPSIHGVFIKTKSNSFPRFTSQTRLVMIDGLGFEWFDEKDSSIKKGSIPLGRIVGASDGGTWGELFGVDILHPGVKGQGNNTYLWCKTSEERDRVIATVNELVKQEKQEAKRVAQESEEGKEGGNKNRKTIIKYRKRRTIRKNKKGTRTTIRKRQRKNRTMRKKARKSMKARKSRKSNKAR